MKLLLVLLVLQITCSYCALKSTEDLSKEVVVLEAVPGEKLRAYEATVFPLLDPRIAALVGVSLQKNTNSKGGSIDVVEFDLNTFYQMTLAFGYFHAQSDVPANSTNGGGAVSASAFAFLLRMFTVFEFDDNNGVDGYQNGTSDQINGAYDLSNFLLQWKPLVANHSMVTDSSGNQYKVWYITAQTSDEVFLIRFTVAGTPLSVSGVHITPDCVKVDFQVNWFTDMHVPAAWTPGPSSATAHPNAKVGVAMGMAALAETVDAQTDGTGNNSPQVSFGTTGYVGFFNWTSSADVVVQGVEAARGVSADVQETDDPNVQAAFKAGWLLRAMWFSFDGTRPSSVAWDPQVGSKIEYSSASSNVVVVALIALLLLVV